MKFSEEEQKLISLTKDLLDSIENKDWKKYSDLCDPSLTCFEPESKG